MEEAAQDIAKAIEEHKIDQLWIPAYEGGNADHDALNGLCAVLWPEEKRKEVQNRQ
jgi:LmbE family N-acetylglucosaminyl deacetylase